MTITEDADRWTELLAQAEGLLADSAPYASGEGASRLEALDDALLLGWTAAEKARARPEGQAAAARLMPYLFYRRRLLKRMAARGVAIGPGLVESVFRGSASMRMFLFVTHACQLRCAYCHVTKDGRQIDDATLEAGVRLMMRALRSEVEFHFFGGEPMLAFNAVRRAVVIAEHLAPREGKGVRFYLTTNGLQLGDKALRFLQRHRISVEFSCDGAHEAQLTQRSSAGGKDYYARLRDNLVRLREASVPYVVITVVVPARVADLLDQFRYLADLGHRSIQINYALGSLWDEASRAEFFRQMDLAAAWARSAGIELVNYTVARREPVMLNGDLTVDAGGGMYRGPVLFDGALIDAAQGHGDAADYRRVVELFSAGRVGGASLPESRGATQFDNFVCLTRAYQSRDTVREIILNNVEMGLACRALLPG